MGSRETTTKKKSSPKKGGKAPALPKAKALDKLRPELARLSPDEVVPPPIPVDRLVGEANALAKVAASELAKLVKVGLDKKLALGLAQRAQALAEAQAIHLLHRGGARRSDEDAALEVSAVKLRADMVADARFALRRDAKVQEALTAIQEGAGLDDLVQDLRALSELFRGHGPLLKKVGVDPKQRAKEATATAERVERALADRRAGSPDDAAERDVRDRAAVLLVRAMSEVRAAGIYAFRGKPSVQSKFRSAYRAKHRAPQAPAAPAEPAV